MTKKQWLAIEAEIRREGPIVLWTGVGSFPGAASRLRGLSFNRKGGLKAALTVLLDIAPRPTRKRTPPPLPEVKP